MQLIDGNPVYSATDLVGFLSCEHLTNLERAAIAGLVERPHRIDPELDRIAKRGKQHEERFLNDLRASGLSIVEIVPDGSIEDRGERLREAAERTAAAMHEGHDVIYQATFFDGQWRGHADFLRRVDKPSELGDWSYEPWDTKLARSTKGSAILQLCVYADLLAQVQKRDPEQLHVALGGSAREVEHFRLADFAAYYRQVKRMFAGATGAGDPAYPPQSRPDPVEHCDVCRWSVFCRDARRAVDDLSLVAGISAKQRKLLRERGVETRSALGVLPLPLEPPLAKTSKESLARVREQARIQVAGDAVAPEVLYELLEPARTKEGPLEPNRGLLSLPAPSPGDLFFDIEGDPFALDDGVDYLFGVLEPALSDDERNPLFHRFWAIEDGEVTLDAERRAFEQVIDLFRDRLAKDPNLHIYHYAPYEPSAMGRLMGRYGTREEEVDELLRGNRFVDLFRAVRQGVRASVESYSIKRLEPLYGFERTIDLRDAGSSIAAFETWLELGGEDPDDPNILKRIEAYNRDDCVSNWLLRDWLEERRQERAANLGEALPRPEAAAAEAPEELSETLRRVKELADRLTTDWSVEAAEASSAVHARWLLAQLLSWHRREEKSLWWRFFYLMQDLTDEERITEPDAMAGITFEGIAREERKSTVYRFRFPPQEHAIEAGKEAKVPPDINSSPGAIVLVSNETGTLEVKRATNRPRPEFTSLVPFEYIGTTELRESLYRVGEWVASNGIEDDGPYRAARDLLLRQPPSLGQAPGDALLQPQERARDGARRLVKELDSTYMAIQGPPGSGKTATAAEMIVDLVEAGRRVGVTANSHKVIGHLLEETAKAASRRESPVRIGQKGSDEGCTYADAECFKDNASVRNALLEGEVDIVGGTPWLWSRADMAGTVNVLFVDEAGQMSLANAIAVSPAGQSLVLLGDPQQLGQPLLGSHPPGAERSVLAHILDGRATMPDELGLFFERTWRLHPDVCRFTSEVFYEGRLQPEPGRERQLVDGVEPIDGAGIRFVAVPHAGHSNESEEEAAELRRLIEALLASDPSWTPAEGDARKLELADILIVTPYNAQVREISERVAGARVGTVDKFQGQEAPISIYSMATSSPEEAPRGMEFLYSLNRLNVATSRARCLTLAIASPELIRVRCRTPRQMRLANALARLVELASVSGADAVPMNSPGP